MKCLLFLVFIVLKSALLDFNLVTPGFFDALMYDTSFLILSSLCLYVLRGFPIDSLKLDVAFLSSLTISFNWGCLDIFHLILLPILLCLNLLS